LQFLDNVSEHLPVLVIQFRENQVGVVKGSGQMGLIGGTGIDLIGTACLRRIGIADIEDRVETDTMENLIDVLIGGKDGYFPARAVARIIGNFRQKSKAGAVNHPGFREINQNVVEIVPRKQALQKVVKGASQLITNFPGQLDDVRVLMSGVINGSGFHNQGLRLMSSMAISSGSLSAFSR
jgi:hypothetical protein